MKLICPACGVLLSSQDKNGINFLTKKNKKWKLNLLRIINYNEEKIYKLSKHTRIHKDHFT